MAATTKIEWATATWNPWIGCTKVSEACRHCYAEREQAGRRKRVTWGAIGTRSRTTDQYWKQLETWNRQAECLQTFDCANGDHSDACPQSLASRPRVFLGSLCDLFERWDGHVHDHRGNLVWCADGKPDESQALPGRSDHILREAGYRPLRLFDLRGRLWPVLERCGNLDFLLLTKRPENIRSMVPYHWLKCWPLNVWAGTTVENQRAARERINHLTRLPAPVRFLSLEPLLEYVDLRHWLPAGRANWQCQKCGAFQREMGDCELCGADCCYLSGSHAANVRDTAAGNICGWTNRQPLDWIICGGESGAEARPSCPWWFRDLRDTAEAAGVAYLFKQWGEWAPCPDDAWHGLGPDGRPPQLVIARSGETAGGFLTQELAGQRAAEGWEAMQRIGKAAAGNELDGRHWLQLPERQDRRLVLPAGVTSC